MFKEFFNRFIAVSKKEEPTLISHLADLREADLKSEEFMRAEFIEALKNIQDLDKEVDRLTKKQRKHPKKHLKLMDAVLEVFKNEGGDLNGKQVFEKINTRKLRNKRPNLMSVKSTIHYLLRRKKIRKGLKRGTFCITMKPAELRLIDKK